MKFCKKFVLSIFLLASIAARGQETVPANVTERTVVLVSIDGLAAFYFDDPDGIRRFPLPRR